MRPALPFLSLLALTSCTGRTLVTGNDAASDIATDASDAAGDIATDSSLPAQWTVSAPGISLEVTRAPYAYVLRDADGHEILRTREAGTGDGYGAIGWTSGSIRWRVNAVSRGYFIFEPQLDPWRDEWTVVDARPMDSGLEVTLQHGDDASQRMIVRHRLFDSSLRVEAHLESGEPRAWSASFATPADEAFLGFGERFNRTNQRGIDVYNWAEEGGIGGHEGQVAGPTNPQPNGQAMSYYPVPFFISSRGYGFWLDTTWRSEFNLATQHDDSWRVWSIAPTLAYEVYLPPRNDSRPWPYRLIDRFTQTVGRPMIPPAWTFGPRRRVGRGSMVDGVREIQAMRDHDLAITGVDDAVHFLPAGSHVGHEAELAQWTRDAHALGYRALAYYNSLLSAATDNPIRTLVDDAIANRWVLRRPDGTPSPVFLISGTPVTVYQIDFSSRDATAWFQSTFDWATDLGYSGWMYDFGEYVQADVITADGRTGEEFHNAYPVLYDRAVHDALESGPHRGDWLAFARSGYTGSSQYIPMVWSGDPAASFEDSDGLPSMVRGGVNMGIAGVPHWGGDIGGFHCVADGYAAANGELLTRWIEQGSMTSNMQDQNACSGALDTGVKASIWNSTDAQTAWSEYGRLHTRLFPYLYSLAFDAHTTGAPTMRHVFLEHPDHPELASVDDAYYFGPALYVAPVVQRNARMRNVLFPPGRFFDWRDGRLYEGGQMVTIDAPLAKLPLFLRDGYLVPMLDATIDTLDDTETNPDVIGPRDVADVFDVVALLSASATSNAAFRLWDRTQLSARWTGSFAVPTGFTEATDPSELKSCTACYRRDPVPGATNVTRLRLSTNAASVDAGGLHLAFDGTRRIRWDLYLVE